MSAREDKELADEIAVNGAMREAIQRMVAQVMSQREEILKAFIAKHGFEPERAVQVEQRQADGSSIWFIRRFTDEEWDFIQKNKPEIKS